MASRGVNKVILVGNLGNDPDVRYLPSGGAVANLTIATSETWRDKATGENREKTEWHRVVLFGKLAEIAKEYLRKGSQVYVEGQLQTRKWQDQSGQDRYSTEVVVQGFNGTLQMLGGRSGGGQQGGYDNGGQQGSWGNPSQGNQQGGQQFSQPNKQYQNNQNQGYAPEQSAPAPAPQSAPQQSPQQAPQYNEPSVDFDDDIPF